MRITLEYKDLPREIASCVRDGRPLSIRCGPMEITIRVNGEEGIEIYHNHRLVVIPEAANHITIPFFRETPIVVSREELHNIEED